MIKILDEILADDNLVWGKNLENNKQKFLVKLNSEIIEELTKSRNELDRIDENELPIFKNYQTKQSSSPPTPSRQAFCPAITPLEVETMARPIPP